jgi:hypothetical protein
MKLAAALARARHLSPLILLGLLLAGCGGVMDLDPTITQKDVKPPEAVVRSVAKRWPGARITSTERTFYLSIDPESWSEYDLTIVPRGRSVPLQSTLRSDGTIRWVSDPLDDPSRQTAGQSSLDLRCHAY